MLSKFKESLQGMLISNKNKARAIIPKMSIQSRGVFVSTWLNNDKTKEKRVKHGK